MLKLLIGIVNYIFSSVGGLVKKDKSYASPPQPNIPNASQQTSNSNITLPSQNPPAPNKLISLLKQKKVIVIIIIIVAFFLSLLQLSTSVNPDGSNLTPTPSTELGTPTPTEGSTQEWIFYRNNQFEYALKYPPEFNIATQINSQQTSDDTTSARLIFIYDPQLEPAYLNRHISIEVLASPPTYGNSWNKEDIAINNIPATKLTNISQPGGFDIYLINTGKDQEVLEIYTANTQDKGQLAKQILSTLELIGFNP